MSRRTVSLVANIVSVNSFTFCMWYFRQFPTIVNQVFSDLLLVSVFVLWVSALVTAAVYANTRRSRFLTLAGISMLAFLARSIPNLRLDFPPLLDGYFYSTVSVNVAQFGTLSPHLLAWYPQLDQLLPWPELQLLSVEGMYVTGLPLMWFMRYQEPLLGALTPIAVYLLARAALNQEAVSLIASLIVACSDLITYYQSEYHPQGLAILFFAMFLFAYIRSASSRQLEFRAIAVVFAISIVFVHHFSSILIAFLACGFVVVSLFAGRSLPLLGPGVKVPSPLRRDRTLWLIMAIAVLSYQVLGYFTVLQGFVTILSVQHAPSLVITLGGGIPIQATVLNSLKWGLVLLAAYAALKKLRHVDAASGRLLTLLALFLLGGIVADFILGGPTDRILTTSLPIIAVFAALGAIYALGKPRSRSRRMRTALIVGLVVIMTGSVLNAHEPSLYFHGSTTNTFYFSSNDFSSIAASQPTGDWIRTHASNTNTNLVEFDTWMPTFYFAGQDWNKTQWLFESRTNPFRGNSSWMFITNPRVPYTYQRIAFNKAQVLADNNLVYANGEIVIALGPGP